jgi:death-on-curing protein
MARRPYLEALYPTPRLVEDFHNTLILQRGSTGYMNQGMVEGCLEWAQTEVFNFVPFPGLLKRGAAMMYAYITFHPFADGNKRTGLMTTSFFFLINGYTFRITDDAPEFALETARRCEDSGGHSPLVEIERIAAWLKPRVSYSILTVATYRKVRNSLSLHATTDDLLRAEGWNTYYVFWRVQTTHRFKELIGGKPAAAEDLIRELLHRDTSL